MANREFHKKTFGLNVTDWKTVVDSYVDANIAMTDTSKIELPKGMFLPQCCDMQEINQDPSDSSKTIEYDYYGPRELLLETDMNAMIGDKSTAHVFAVRYPGFIYRSHENGLWISNGSIRVLASKGSIFDPDMDGNPVFELYNTEHGGYDHGECMFPIYTSLIKKSGSYSYTYLMIISTPPRDVIRRLNTKRLWFLPAYHFKSSKLFNYSDLGEISTNYTTTATKKTTYKEVLPIRVLTDTNGQPEEVAIPSEDKITKGSLSDPVFRDKFFDCFGG